VTFNLAGSLSSLSPASGIEVSSRLLGHGTQWAVEPMDNYYYYHLRSKPMVVNTFAEGIK
jgi:hypothetical protein